jgi:hypothetical protein
MRPSENCDLSQTSEGNSWSFIKLKEENIFICDTRVHKVRSEDMNGKDFLLYTLCILTLASILSAWNIPPYPQHTFMEWLVLLFQILASVSVRSKSSLLFEQY